VSYWLNKFLLIKNITLCYFLDIYFLTANFPTDLINERSSIVKYLSSKPGIPSLKFHGYGLM